MTVPNSLQLSICIPTYNRAAFIGATLESIARQARQDVEVVVSDNASTDDTAEIVESFRDRIPNLVYSRSETNVGFAANFMRAVALSHGTYAWLLGSDDVLCDGMLQQAVGELSSGDVLYIYDRTETDVELNPRKVDTVLDERTSQRQFVLGDRAELLRYFEHSRSIASLFSFISSVVFRRAEWDGVGLKPAWLDCFFPHAIRMWAMFRNGGTLRYVPAPLVLARLENDTFNPGDAQSVRRMLLNFEGYRMIADEHWKQDRALVTGMHRVMRRSHPVRGLLKLRRIISPREIGEVCVVLGEYGYGSVFTWFYGTDVCRRMIVSLKRLYVSLGLSPDLAAQ